MERKGAGMTEANRFNKFSFWRGKDIYNLMYVPKANIH